MSLLTSESKDSAGHKFLPAKQPKAPLTKQQQEDNVIFNERLRKTYQGYTRVRLQYNPANYGERKQLAKEKASVVLQQEYPDLTVKRLLNVTRVLFPAGENLYEDSEGKLDPKVRSALYYTVEVSIQRAESTQIGIFDDYIHSTIFKIGKYSAPRVKPEFDKDHNHVNSHIVGQMNRYYVADSKKNIEDIIKRFGAPCKAFPWNVAIASPSGVEIPFIDDRRYTITKFEDWLTGDISELIEANRYGFYRINRGNNNNNNGNGSSSLRIDGLDAFLRWQKAKDEALDKGVLLDAKEFREGKGKEKPSEK